MSKKLSFAIAVNLLTENFKSGANNVKNGLRAMQMQVLTFAAALGFGGISLSNFVSKLIDTARETSRVTTALKNVSNGAAGYVDNQRYLIELAKKYGLEVNALTGNFAKFTASASMAGMSMADQRKIFESVSRSVSAFGLTAGESDGVMLALSQMMSKGKIASQELRIQMGEKLPIALQAMAKAAGVSVGELDKLMSKGKLTSDILVKFADALNDMTPNVDTDNLETSYNRLSNTFGDLSDILDISGKQKSMIDKLTEIIASGAENIKNIIVLVVAAIGFVVGNGLVKIIKQWDAFSMQTITNSKTVNAQLAATTAKRVAAEKGLDESRLQHSIATGNKKIKAAEKVAQKELLLAKAVVAEDKARIAAEQAAAAGKIGVWNRSFNVIKVGAAKASMAIKSMWSSFAPGLIFAGIIAFIGYIKNIHDETKRIKNLFSDYKGGVESAKNNAEINQLRTLQKIANDMNATYDDRAAAINTINQKLGTNYNIDKNSLKINGDINAKIAERVKLLEQQAKADYYSTEKIKAEDQIRKIYRKHGGEKAFNFQVGNEKQKYDSSIYNLGKPEILLEVLEIKELSAVIADAEKEITEATKYLNKNGTTSKPTSDPDKNDALQKVEEKYKKSIEELNARREVEKMTLTEYNKALDELNKRYYIEARGSNDASILKSEYFRKLQTAVEKPLYNKDQALFENVQKEYSDELKKLSNQYKNKALTEKEYKEKLTELMNKTVLAAGALAGIGIEGQAFIATLKVNSSLLKTPSKKITPEKYDTTFDYKKSGLDIQKEKLKIAETYRDELKDAVKEGAAELQKELNAAMSNVTSLSEAVKIAEVKGDVKNLQKELNEGLYSGMKNIASSSDRVVNAFSNLREVMNDVNASGWEKILSIWNALTNTIDGFLSIIKTIETITEVTNKLALAKQREADIDTEATAVKVENAAVSIAAKVTEVGVVSAAASTEVAANTGIAASTVGAQASKMAPFPLNLAIIAGAIASVLAIFSSIPKFASGGIVAGGSYNGDKVLAGLNSGEMVLNHGQQSKLFRAINQGQMDGNNAGASGQVVFRIEGSHLVGVLNNYNRRNSKIR